MDARSIILDRIALLRRELDQLEILVGGTPRPPDARGTTPMALEPEGRPTRRIVTKPTPQDRELDESGLGPAEAAELLGIARQTVDRRLKEGRSDVPGAPRDVSGGAHRARWRWTDEEQIRRWWAAVR